MASAIFDTHAFVKRLVGAGMPEQQAEILAEEQARLIGEHLATKADLRELKDQLTIRLGGMVTAAVIIVAALVRLF